MKKIPIILDGDPGHDDAIAWMLANASPLLDIRAVTSVCGNQTIEKTTYNALRITDPHRAARADGARAHRAARLRADRRADRARQVGARRARPARARL
ncbi:MAG: nucleoside hydrolase [Anaerotruncus massiliensis (ex Togo et al. 2019)]